MTHRSLDGILERAHAELLVNPTITIYIITHDGIEMRWPAPQYELMAIRDSLNEVRAKYEKLGVSFALVDHALKQRGG